MVATSRNQSRGTGATAGNYKRLLSTFGPAQEVQGRYSATQLNRFSAAMAINNLFLLVLVVIASAAATSFVRVSGVWVFIAAAAAFGVAIWTSLRPQVAKRTVFAYAVLEGAVLGWFSNLMSSGDRGIIEMAIIGTTVIFLGVLVAYRTGLVKVSPSFVRIVGVATLGAVIAGFAMVLFSLAVPSNSFVFVAVFGYLYLLLGTANLFVDFDYLYQAEAAGIDADGEWYGAFMMLVSLVLVYMSLLRILGGRR